ncbi:hypothetical protein LTR66_000329 [Elasticomyces elasticus]|nr:hypothetical protein LTR66_000329 [Elasticomyces elasticus]
MAKAAIWHVIAAFPTIVWAICSSLGFAGAWFPTFNGNTSSPLDRRAGVALGVPLRILPLGDSITFGYRSSDGNGYRLDLLNHLTNSGSQVTYIGSVTDGGNMANKANEGHVGYTISQIAAATVNTLRQEPNVVLLHAGTNDMNLDPPPDPYDAAPQRLASLIDEVLCTCPNTTLIVAQIISSTNGGTSGRVPVYNTAIPGIVAERVKKGFKVLTVDMSSIGGSRLIDGLHPTDQGYDDMATLWYQALEQASSKGWITPPESALAVSHNVAQECASGFFWYPANNGNQIASGVGTGGDSVFHNNWIPQGRVADGLGRNGMGVVFADLDGDGKDEYIWVNETTGSVIAYQNRWDSAANKPHWFPINGGNPIASGIGNGTNVKWADVNADYLYVLDGGAVDAYINNGPDSSPQGWSWSGPRRIATGVPGATPASVMFADINADGRADYLVKSATGGLDLWLNTGAVDSADIVWVPYPNMAGGLGNPNITLADLNGDGRADYLMWDADGGLSGYLNVRTNVEGRPTWIPQGGAKSIASGVAPPGNIRMADINGDGKVDYVIVDAATGAIELYLNNGEGDASVVGDGIRFADLDGDGIDDYVAVDHLGRLLGYVNGGASSASPQGWIWFPQNSGNFIATGVPGVTRDMVHLADIDGDGKADFLIVNPTTGAVDCYINGGANTNANGGWIWIPRGQIASGIGAGAGVRFADIDGDGRADYIWLAKNGAATVYINKVFIIPNNWVPANDGKPIASGVGASRSEVRFADINGDGRADYLWLHTVDGAADVWYNGGADTGANGGWLWYPQGRIATGIAFSGPDIQFGRLDSTGRAAYLAVDASHGALVAYLNGCQHPIGNIPSKGTSPAATSTCGSPPLPSNTDGSGVGGSGSGTVYISPDIWQKPNPVVQCQPPCTFVFPPWTLSAVTTIKIPPVILTVEDTWVTTITLPGAITTTSSVSSTKVTAVTIPPITTSVID